MENPNERPKGILKKVSRFDKPEAKKEEDEEDVM